MAYGQSPCRPDPSINAGTAYFLLTGSVPPNGFRAVRFCDTPDCRRHVRLEKIHYVHAQVTSKDSDQDSGAIHAMGDQPPEPSTVDSIMAAAEEYLTRPGVSEHNRSIYCRIHLVEKGLPCLCGHSHHKYATRKSSAVPAKQDLTLQPGENGVPLSILENRPTDAPDKIRLAMVAKTPHFEVVAGELGNEKDSANQENSAETQTAPEDSDDGREISIDTASERDYDRERDIAWTFYQLTKPLRLFTHSQRVAHGEEVHGRTHFPSDSEGG